MQEVTINKITIYSDNGLIEIEVTCNLCKSKNIHTITHASKQTGIKTEIDFLNLGKRHCHNMKCCRADYQLYKV